jgi:hypothetical protein
MEKIVNDYLTSGTLIPDVQIVNEGCMLGLQYAMVLLIVVFNLDVFSVVGSPEHFVFRRWSDMSSSDGSLSIDHRSSSVIVHIFFKQHLFLNHLMDFDQT